MWMNKILQGNCVDVMMELEGDIVDLTITSPPYDSLRDYGSDWELDIDGIVSQLYRITKPGGVVVWVVGDGTHKGSETGTSFKQALKFMDIGFNLHDTMIYQKNNFSNPSSNRYHQIFEYMFVFSKGKPKTFNPLMDRENITAGEIGSWGKNTSRQRDGSMKERKRKIVKPFGMRWNIWKYKTSKNGQEDSIAYKHPAIFPIGLVIDHILSWSNEGDLIFDPFMGSGTTAVGSIKTGRKWLGIEINHKYIEIIKHRI